MKKLDKTKIFSCLSDGAGCFKYKSVNDTKCKAHSGLKYVSKNTAYFALFALHIGHFKKGFQKKVLNA